MEQTVVCSFWFSIWDISRKCEENGCIREEVLLRTREFLKRRKSSDTAPLSVWISNNVGGTVTKWVYPRVLYGLVLVTSIFKQGLHGGSGDSNVNCLWNDRHAKAGRACFSTNTCLDMGLWLCRYLVHVDGYCLLFHRQEETWTPRSAICIMQYARCLDGHEVWRQPAIDNDRIGITSAVLPFPILYLVSSSSFTPSFLLHLSCHRKERGINTRN
jgi:hypothetical protein